MIPQPRLREKLIAEGIDVIVASSPQNVFYLSGLQNLSQELLGNRAFVIRTQNDHEPFIVLPAVDISIIVDTDRDYEQVYTYSSFYLYESGDITDADQEVRMLKNEQNYETPLNALVAALDPLTDGGSIVAFEQTELSPEENETIKAEVNYAKLRATEDICSDLRRVKSSTEVQRLQRSVEINQASIMAAVEELEPGMTERDLAAIYEQYLVSHGADPLFTVIGFGAHGAYPRAIPGDREIQEGDLIRCDVGCTYENYASDIARTFAFQTTTETLKRKYAVLNASLDRSIELLEDDVTTKEVFDASLTYIREEGADVFESFNRTHFGHGIGIDVYDSPTINREPNHLTAGMVMCVEPPYYELGTGGIQIEDEVLITDDGVERFSRCPDSLKIIE